MRTKDYLRHDITNAVVLVICALMVLICRFAGIDIERIYISFREIEKEVIRFMNDMMRQTHPYDYNSKMSFSTDASASKIRSICNK